MAQNAPVIMLDLLSQHSTSTARLEALPIALQASKPFLQHAVEVVDHIVHQGYAEPCWLHVRGSVANGDACRHSADLDADFILPVSYQLPPERLDDPLQQFVTTVQEVAEKIWYTGTALQYCLQPLRELKELTRSIPFTLHIMGEKLEVDLFPKLLDDSGKVWSLEKKLKDDIVQYIWEPSHGTLLQLLNEPKLDLHQHQLLAVLLLKVWKSEQLDRANFKSYHIRKAVKEVAQYPYALTHCDSSWGNAEDNFRSLDEAMDDTRFYRDTLICMINIVSFAHGAYGHGAEEEARACQLQQQIEDGTTDFDEWEDMVAPGWFAIEKMDGTKHYPFFDDTRSTERKPLRDSLNELLDVLQQKYEWALKLRPKKRQRFRTSIITSDIDNSD